MSVLDFISKNLTRYKSYPIYRKEHRLVIQEISDYFEISRNDAIRRILNGPNIARDEWLLANPITAEQMIQAYGNSEGYIYDLTWFNNFSSYEFAFRRRIGEECKEAKRFLDYGGGIGSMSIHISQSTKGQCELVHYDVPGKCYSYAKWRLERRGIHASFIEADDDHDPLHGSFDAITCLEVLEHVADPVLHAKRIVRHLKPNGQLFVTAPFGNTEKHPQHRDFTKTADQLLSEVGMEPVNFGLFGAFTKWIKLR